MVLDVVWYALWIGYCNGVLAIRGRGQRICSFCVLAFALKFGNSYLFQVVLWCCLMNMLPLFLHNVKAYALDVQFQFGSHLFIKFICPY